uniref:Uncharacterized protein n=1 Tax=Biomphalaria glabrata TaxID=6526 RepID=A0A2C9KXT0_BIOGL
MTKTKHYILLALGCSILFAGAQALDDDGDNNKVKLKDGSGKSRDRSRTDKKVVKRGSFVTQESPTRSESFQLHLTDTKSNVPKEHLGSGKLRAILLKTIKKIAVPNDFNGNGIHNALDKYSKENGVLNYLKVDTDGDGVPDHLDDDDDNDGIPDSKDNDRNGVVINTLMEIDTDGDGIPDYIDDDDDNDGIPDELDDDDDGDGIPDDKEV